MKPSLLPVTCWAFLAGASFAGAPAQIAIGKPNWKVFPATNDTPASVYIEVCTTTTNTSTEAITFTTFISGPNFLEYVRLKRISNHWTNTSAKGMCGMNHSSQTLAAGASVESTLLIRREYSGKPLRLVLTINTPASDSHSGIRITSERITLP